MTCTNIWFAEHMSQRRKFLAPVRFARVWCNRSALRWVRKCSLSLSCHERWSCHQARWTRSSLLLPMLGRPNTNHTRIIKVKINLIQLIFPCAFLLPRELFLCSRQNPSSFRAFFLRADCSVTQRHFYHLQHAKTFSIRLNHGHNSYLTQSRKRR